jgi:hypothetical protein
LTRIRRCGLICGPCMVGYRSGQTGQTVNLLAYAFNGSNPFLPNLLRNNFEDLEKY